MRTKTFILYAMTLMVQQIPCIAANEKFAVEEGTSVKLRLEEAVSTKDSVAGQKLKLTVLEDVLAKDGKTVVVKEGTRAIGYLSNLDEKEGSKGGKLCVEVSSVKAVDGTRIALRGIKTKSGAGGAGVGSYLAGGLLFGVVGLGAVALAGRSHNAKIPAGTMISSFVDKDATIEINQTSVAKESQTDDKPVVVDDHSTEIASDNVDAKNAAKTTGSKTSD